MPVTTYLPHRVTVHKSGRIVAIQVRIYDGRELQGIPALRFKDKTGAQLSLSYTVSRWQLENLSEKECFFFCIIKFSCVVASTFSPHPDGLCNFARA